MEKQTIRPCEKISVNSTTVIKNDIVERLEKQPLIFLQYTINTVICQVSSTVSLLKWSVAEWKQTDCAGSAQPVGVHDLQLAKNSAPVSQRHSPLLCNLVGCQIQSLKKGRIAGKHASLFVQTAIAAVKAFDRIGSVNDLSHISGKLEV